MDRHPYILGTGDSELDRLARQHDIWRATTSGLWDTAGFGSGQRLVDLGCGPGFTSFELAARVGPSGQVIAVDNSPRFIDVLRTWCLEREAANIEPRLADAADPGLEDRSVDGIFVRWLLCFLPETGRIIQRAATALRPGGRLVVMDYFHYLAIQNFPETRIFTRVFRQIYRSFEDAGGDLDVGNRLPGLMRDAGLELRHIEPIVEIAQPASAVWQWVRAFLKSYLPTLAEKGYLSEKEIERFEADWVAHSEDPASFLLSPPMLGVVARKPESGS